MGLSTWALKLDSLDPDPQSRFNVVSHGMQTTRSESALKRASHRISRTDQGHCHAARAQHSHAAQIQIEAMWRQSGLWI